MSFVEIENHTIKMMASYIDEDNKLTLRLLNATESKQISKVLGTQEATIHKLDGTLMKEAKAAGMVWGRPAFELEFQPFELITVKITNVEPSNS